LKLLLIALLLVAPMACRASPLEDAYFTARDDYVAKIKAIDDAGKLEDNTPKLHKRALEQLGKLTQPIVGPVALKGFSAKGQTNLDSLYTGDFGFGLMDGLNFASPDGKTHIIVTTESLFVHWLREHRDWWGSKSENVPQEIDAALRSEAFYTQALQTDSHISRYVELPVARPAKAKFALAMLIARTQILGPRIPDELIVAVVSGGRVFVINASARTRVKPIPACDAIWKESERKAAEAQDAYIASQLEDKTLSDQRNKAEEDGDAAFHRCFAERAGGRPFFAALTRQAQALLESAAGELNQRRMVWRCPGYRLSGTGPSCDTAPLERRGHHVSDRNCVRRTVVGRRRRNR
jgi:hypothetical protein